ncbi:MAG: SpoVA/SpoVAEb family sporulation membrane protein [Lachnospiraceae bacterium]|nr:SpoVA/SpoVAEb family sporulation membrane protein [Lachnospiraceae bacterium]
MGSIKNEETKKEYEAYVKQVTPKNSLPIAMVKAFAVGGFICMLGEGILKECERMGLDKEMSGAWCSLILVAASALLTGLNVYQRLVAFSGAGALVPITGFANSVAAPAIEYQKEGQIFGIGSKIFTIAGPVILYGVFTSWVLGLIYWVGKYFQMW